MVKIVIVYIIFTGIPLIFVCGLCEYVRYSRKIERGRGGENGKEFERERDRVRERTGENEN